MSTSHPHTAKSVFFGCIDDRLIKADADFIAAHGDSFWASLAGGGAAFLAPEDRAVALKQIMVSYMVNQAQRVYLQSHTNCGAYRLAGVTFSSHEEELKRLYADLDQAATDVRAALIEAGAKPSDIHISTQVVDPAGVVQPRTAQPLAAAH